MPATPTKKAAAANRAEKKAPQIPLVLNQWVLPRF